MHFTKNIPRPVAHYGDPFGPHTLAIRKAEAEDLPATQRLEGQPAVLDTLGRALGQHAVLSEALKRVMTRYPLDTDVRAAMAAAKTGSEYLDSIVQQLNAESAPRNPEGELKPIYPVTAATGLEAGARVDAGDPLAFRKALTAVRADPQSFRDLKGRAHLSG